MRIPRGHNELELSEFGSPDSVSGTILIDGIRIYNKYIEMSRGDLELLPCLHLNREEENREELEEWMDLRTLLEWSGTL